MKREMTKKALVPTYLYPTVILNILKKYKINSISHITGGGLLENLPRSIPIFISGVIHNHGKYQKFLNGLK